MGVRLDHGDDLSEVHEINVTPFIDVILVLLIIFMIRRHSPRSTSRSICRRLMPSARRGQKNRCFSR